MTVSGNFVSLATQPTAVASAMLLVVLLDHDLGTAAAVFAMVVAVVLVGVVQAVLVAAGLNPIITTLATASIVLGAAITLSESKPVSLTGPALGWGNSPCWGYPSRSWSSASSRSWLTSGSPARPSAGPPC